MIAQEALGHPVCGFVKGVIKSNEHIWIFYLLNESVEAVQNSLNHVFTDRTESVRAVPESVTPGLNNKDGMTVQLTKQLMEQVIFYIIFFYGLQT